MNDVDPVISVPQLIKAPEIDVAVEWWGNQLLGKAELNTGNLIGDLLAREARDKLWHPLSPDQIRRFKYYLKMVLVAAYALSWDIDNPNWGSAIRAITTDYGPGYFLHIALELAHVENADLRIPMKTTMHVDPGKVTVGVGHGTKLQVIWKKDD
jgi:hypothetical protein